MNVESDNPEKIGQALVLMGESLRDGLTTLDIHEASFEDLGKRVSNAFTLTAQAHLHHKNLTIDNFHRTVGACLLEELCAKPNII